MSILDKYNSGKEFNGGTFLTTADALQLNLLHCDTGDLHTDETNNHEANEVYYYDYDPLIGITHNDDVKNWITCAHPSPTCPSETICNYPQEELHRCSYSTVK